MNIIARRLAAVAGAAVLGLSIAAPAQAARYDHTDAAGDVLQCDINTECETSQPAATQNPDVRGVSFRHKARRVVVVARFADIAKNSDTKGFVASIRTNEGVKRDVSVYASGSYSEIEVARPNGAVVACRGAERKIDYSLNTVTMSVPRSCLSGPRWVRVGFTAFAMPGVDLTQTRIDDGLYNGESTTLVLSPRIRRG